MLSLMKKAGGPIVECYVVRIYRRNREDTSLADGVVEVPGENALRVFHSAGELLDGLAFPARGGKAANGKDRNTNTRRGV